jgi:hypothetical protein
MNNYRLSAANHKAISNASDPGGLRDKRAFSQAMGAKRAKSIGRWYRKGGGWFLEWVKKYYRTWTGEPLRWDDVFLEDLFILIGNPWLISVYAEKPAQTGWTEATIAFNAFVISEVRVPTAYGVEKELKLGDIVAPLIKSKELAYGKLLELWELVKSIIV